jgi:hypothetical protein
VSKKKTLDLVEASKALSRHPGLLARNKGKWIAVAIAGSRPSVVGKSSSLGALVKSVGPSQLKSVLLTRVPRNLNAVCAY